MNGTKQCIYCKELIDKKAKICPKCQKKQGVGCLGSVIASVCTIIIVPLAIGACFGGNRNSEPEVSETLAPVENIEETEPPTEEEITEPETEAEAEEPTTEEATEPETEPPTTEIKKELEVEIEPSYEFIDNKLFVTINTNLPDDTNIIITITNYYDFTAQSKAVVKNGVAVSEGFSNNGERLDDLFEVRVSTSIASLQSQSVIDIIGEKGEFLTGEYVEESSIGGNVVSAEFDLDTFDLEVSSPAPTNAPTEAPTPAPAVQIGKNVDELSLFTYYGDVRNDVTGNWRYAVCADAGKNIAEYAVSYYSKYMSDGEIHAVINFSDRTTTKITKSAYSEDLYLTVYNYVDGEEHDAKLMFGGNVIAYYTVNIETGEITEE